MVVDMLRGDCGRCSRETLGMFGKVQDASGPLVGQRVESSPIYSSGSSCDRKLNGAGVYTLSVDAKSILRSRMRPNLSCICIIAMRAPNSLLNDEDN
jgi:hypothetical protein